MDRLKGKVALITGAGTGVGRACMKLFAAEGAKVVGVSRTQSQSRRDAGSGESRPAATEHVVAADLAKPDGADKAVKAALDAYGRIDILVNSRRRRLQLAREEPRLDGSRR